MSAKANGTLLYTHTSTNISVLHSWIISLLICIPFASPLRLPSTYISVLWFLFLILVSLPPCILQSVPNAEHNTPSFSWLFPIDLVTMTKRTSFRPWPSHQHTEIGSVRNKSVELASSHIENAGSGCTKYGQLLKRYGKFIFFYFYPWFLYCPCYRLEGVVVLKP